MGSRNNSLVETRNSSNAGTMGSYKVSEGGLTVASGGSFNPQDEDLINFISSSTELTKSVNITKSSNMSSGESTGLVQQRLSAQQDSESTHLPLVLEEDTQPQYSDICIERQDSVSGYLPDFGGIARQDSEPGVPDSGGLAVEENTVNLNDSSSAIGDTSQSLAFLPDFAQLGDSGENR